MSLSEGLEHSMALFHACPVLRPRDMLFYMEKVLGSSFMDFPQEG